MASVYTAVEWPTLYRSASGSTSIFSGNPEALLMLPCIDPSLEPTAYLRFTSIMVAIGVTLLGLLLKYTYNSRKPAASRETSAALARPSSASIITAGVMPVTRLQGGRASFIASSVKATAIQGQINSNLQKCEKVTSIAAAELLFVIMYPM